MSGGSHHRTVAEFQLRRAVCRLRKDCDKQRIIRHLAAKVNQRAVSGGIMAARAKKGTRQKPKSKGRRAAKVRRAKAKARPKARPRPKARKSGAAPSVPEGREGQEGQGRDRGRPRQRRRKAKSRPSTPKAAARAARREVQAGAAQTTGPRPRRQSASVQGRSPSLLWTEAGACCRRTNGWNRPLVPPGASTERMARSGHDELRAELGAAQRKRPQAHGRRCGRQVAGRVRRRRRSAGRRQSHARSGSRGRHRPRARHPVPGRSGAAGRRRSRGARQASLGAGPGLVRGLAARQEGRRRRSAVPGSFRDDVEHPTRRRRRSECPSCRRRSRRPPLSGVTRRACGRTCRARPSSPATRGHSPPVPADRVGAVVRAPPRAFFGRGIQINLHVGVGKHGRPDVAALHHHAAVAAIGALTLARARPGPADGARRRPRPDRFRACESRRSRHARRPTRGCRPPGPLRAPVSPRRLRPAGPARDDRPATPRRGTSRRCPRACTTARRQSCGHGAFARA